MNLRAWTWPRTEPVVPIVESADELTRVRAELAHLRIRLAAAEQAANNWQRIHEESIENWRALYARDTAILRAALMDTHEALVRDRESPEDRACAGMVTQ